MAQSKFLDLTTDFGFKRVFGTEANKDLLLAFLNELFSGRKVIKDLVYNKNEHVGDVPDIGTVIFDLTCTGDNGAQFVIEVQRTSQINLKQRMLYYGSKLICDQAPKGGRKAWSYGITEVYVIVLMDGITMPDSEDATRYLHDICLCYRDSGEIFYTDLGFIYIELTNFVKEESVLQDDLDKWLYVLKNMSKMYKLPTYLRKPIFEKLFQIAEYANLSKEEREMYDVSLKHKWDTEAVRQFQEQQLEEATEKGIEIGTEKGLEKGLERKSFEVVEGLITKLGLSDEQIADVAKVSVDFVQKVRNSLKK